MFGERLPKECHKCGEDVSGVSDHALGCSVAIGVLKRVIERDEETLGGPWELDETEARLTARRELLKKHENESEHTTNRDSSKKES